MTATTYLIRKQEVTTAYARNGNAHRPTIESIWQVFAVDEGWNGAKRVHAIDTYRLRRDAVALVRRLGLAPKFAAPLKLHAPYELPKV